MLNLREGCVFVELNYPHIIGISGYERHHDVAIWSGEIRLNSPNTTPAPNEYLLAPIVPNQVFQNPSALMPKCSKTQLFWLVLRLPFQLSDAQTHGKPWRSKGRNRFKILKA